MLPLPEIIDIYGIQTYHFIACSESVNNFLILTRFHEHLICEYIYLFTSDLRVVTTIIHFMILI